MSKRGNKARKSDKSRRNQGAGSESVPRFDARAVPRDLFEASMGEPGVASKLEEMAESGELKFFLETCPLSKTPSTWTEFCELVGDPDLVTTDCPGALRAIAQDPRFLWECQQMFTQPSKKQTVPRNDFPRYIALLLGVVYHVLLDERASRSERMRSLLQAIAELAITDDKYEDCVEKLRLCASRLKNGQARLLSTLGDDTSMEFCREPKDILNHMETLTVEEEPLFLCRVATERPEILRKFWQSEFSFLQEWIPFVNYLITHRPKVVVVLDRISQNLSKFLNPVRTALRQLQEAPDTSKTALAHAISTVFTFVKIILVDVRGDTKRMSLLTALLLEVSAVLSDLLDIEETDELLQVRRARTATAILMPKSNKFRRAAMEDEQLRAPNHDWSSEDLKWWRLHFHPDLIEILSDREAYLPTEDGTTEEYLEKQARMYREEAIRPYNKAVRAFIEDLHTRMDLVSKPDDLRADGHVFLLFHNMERMDAKKYKFNLPKGAGQSKKRNWEYWKSEGSKHLSTATPMLLVFKRTEDGSFHFYPCVISKGVKVSDCSREVGKPTIYPEVRREVSLTFRGEVPHVEANHKSVCTLVGVHGVFFLTPQSVVKRLKHYHRKGLPFQEHICVPPQDTYALDESENCTPEYLWDRELIFPGGQSGDPTLTFKLRGTFRETWEMLQNHPALAAYFPTQRKAFVAALTQRVALIQGPPGTGKSYIAQMIVQFLVTNFRDHAIEHSTDYISDEFISDEFMSDEFMSDESISDESISEELLPEEPLPEASPSAPSDDTASEDITSDEQMSNDDEEDEEEYGIELSENDLLLPILLVCQTNHALDDFLFCLSRGFNIPRERIRRLGEATEQFKGYLDRCTWTLGCNRSLCDGVDIIGATTSYCAIHRDIIESISPIIVICEEASEVLECHMLQTLFPRTQHLILVGDHLQLCPTVMERRLRGHPLSFDKSLFERLVYRFGTGAAELQQMRSCGRLVTLETQWRMAPDISQLIKVPQLYPDLKDHPQVMYYQPAEGFRDRVWFLTHDEEEVPGHAGGYSNPQEADYVVQLARYMLLQRQPIIMPSRENPPPGNEVSYPWSSGIAIITPYGEQERLLRKKLREESKVPIVVQDQGVQVQRVLPMNFSYGDPEFYSLGDLVRLSTVDSFQGEEASVIILSLVRNNDRGEIGFLNDLRRVNVMLSRAKATLVIVGSAETIRNCKDSDGILPLAVQTLDGQSRVQRYLPLTCQNHREHLTVVPETLEKFAKHGGCRLKCTQVFPCGHTCTRTCHPTTHEGLKCEVELSNTCAQCGHETVYKCGDGAPSRCEVPRVLELGNCPHSTILCYQSREREQPNFKCEMECGVAFESCPHTCREACWKCFHRHRNPKHHAKAHCQEPGCAKKDKRARKKRR